MKIDWEFWKAVISLWAIIFGIKYFLTDSFLISIVALMFFTFGLMFFIDLRIERNMGEKK